MATSRLFIKLGVILLGSLYSVTDLVRLGGTAVVIIVGFIVLMLALVDNIKIAKALSDPIRYKIMQMLARSREGCCPLPGESDHWPGLCNCELMAVLGLIQSRVSYHMKELIEAGLVAEEPRGRWKVYFINTKTLGQYIELLKRDFALEKGE